jgi:hypothetical protein
MPKSRFGRLNRRLLILMMDSFSVTQYVILWLLWCLYFGANFGFACFQGGTLTAPDVDGIDNAIPLKNMVRIAISDLIWSIDIVSAQETLKAMWSKYEASSQRVQSCYYCSIFFYF